MSREHTGHLKSNVPCGTISGRGLSVVITRRGLLMKFLIPKHAEANYFPVRVCTLPLPALPFPILRFRSPAMSSMLLQRGDEGLPGKRKQLEITAGAGKGRSWWRDGMEEMESYQESVCGTWMIPSAHEWHTWAEEKTKWAAQTQRSLSSPPPCPWGSGPFSSRHRLSASPRNRGTRPGCVQPPWESETKEKQEKRLPRMYPPLKGIHSEKQREFF